MSAPPPPTAPPPPADDTRADGTDGVGPRRLTRLRRGRLIGGVAVGLAQYLGVDRVIVRVGFVVLAFVPFPGFGVLVYLAMLLLVPTQDADGTLVSPRLTERTPAFWVGLGLVGLATFALLGVWGDGRGVGFAPLLLIGLGVALWVDADRRPATADRQSDRGAAATGPSWSAPSAPATAPIWQAPTEAARPSSTEAPGPSSTEAAPPPATATTAPQAPVWADGGGAPPGGPPAPTGPAWTPPPVRRERSPLGRVTLGSALLAGGGVWLVDLLGIASIPVASMMAAALLVLGLGLLVGSVAGRARWLALVVAFLLPVTFIAAALDDLGIDLVDGVEQVDLHVTEAAQLDAPLSVFAGELYVDLTGVPDVDGLVVDATVGAGELRVLVPEGMGVTGRARLEVGELELLGDRSGGVSIDREVDVPADPGRPTVTLDLRLGAGEVVVRTVPLPADDQPSDDQPSDDLDVEPALDDATTEVQP